MNRLSPPNTIQFPVNLNCINRDHDHQDHHRSLPSDEKRPIMDEMDFFAHKKDDDDHHSKGLTDNISDADEDKAAFCGPPFNVNVSIYIYNNTSLS